MCSSVPPWCIVVVGRDFCCIAVARVKLGSAARERTKAPNTRITSANLSLLGPIFHYMHYFSYFFEKILPAHTGSIFLQITPSHFLSKVPLFGPPNKRKKSHFPHFVRFYRSLVRSVPFFSLHAPVKKPTVPRAPCVFRLQGPNWRHNLMHRNARGKLGSTACERTMAPNIRITCANLSLLGPIFNYMHDLFISF